MAKTAFGHGSSTQSGEQQWQSGVLDFLLNHALNRIENEDSIRTAAARCLMVKQNAAS